MVLQDGAVDSKNANLAKAVPSNVELYRWRAVFIAGTNLSNQEFDVERNTYGVPPMIRRIALATLAIASACYVMPAAADEVGVGVGPAGVEVHGDRDRDKTVIEKEKRTPDGDRDKTVIINKDRDGDRDKTVIHHD